MRIYIAIVTFFCIFCLKPLHAQSQNGLLSPHVFQIQAKNCKYTQNSRWLTGFRIKGTPGIVTALHGVADCDQINAISVAPNTVPFIDLKIVKVDIDRDVALLAPSGNLDSFSDTEGLRLGPNVFKGLESVSVIGHPLGMNAQLPSDQLQLRKIPTVLLSGLLPLDKKFADELEIRNSPAATISVLSIDGDLSPGHSGSPVQNANGVIGVVNGGLNGGASGIVWAIPWSDIVWQPITEVQEKFDKLKKHDPSFLLSEEVAQSENLLHLKIRVTSINGNVDFPLEIDRIVLANRKAAYPLSTQEIDWSQTSISIQRLVSFTGQGSYEVFASGSIGEVVVSTDKYYKLQVANLAGILMLEIIPTKQISLSGSVYGCSLEDPIADAKVTLSIHEKTSNETLEFSVNKRTGTKGGYSFRLEYDSEEYFGRIVVSEVPYGFEDYDTGSIELDMPVEDIYLTRLNNPCTSTITPSPIPISTLTATPTGTSLGTPTPTGTLQPTGTETVTRTITPTKTPTLPLELESTSTGTATSTPTFTVVSPKTDVSTNTGTGTSTSTPTDTPKKPVAPTATFTLYPILTATPSLLSSSVVVTTSNLRAGPGTSYKILSTVEAGATVRPVGVSSDNEWYLLDTGYWIYKGLLNTPPANLPTVPANKISPTPTQSPTRQATLTPIQPSPTATKPVMTATPTVTLTPTNTPTPVSEPTDQPTIAPVETIAPTIAPVKTIAPTIVPAS